MKEREAKCEREGECEGRRRMQRRAGQGKAGRLVGGLATTDRRQWSFINTSSDGHFVTVPQPGNSWEHGRRRNTQESTSPVVMTRKQNAVSRIIMVTVAGSQGSCNIQVM